MAADKSDMQIILQFLGKRMDEIISLQSQRGLKASGESAELLRVAEDDNIGQLVDGSGSFEQQNFGRAGGKAPPFQKIFDWLAFKKYGINYQLLTTGEALRGMTAEQKRKSIAWAITNKIAKKGTYTHITGKPTGVLTDSISLQSLELLKDVLAEKKKVEILTDIKRIFN